MIQNGWLSGEIEEEIEKISSLCNLNSFMLAEDLYFLSTLKDRSKFRDRLSLTSYPWFFTKIEHIHESKYVNFSIHFYRFFLNNRNSLYLDKTFLKYSLPCGFTHQFTLEFWKVSNKQYIPEKVDIYDLCHDILDLCNSWNISLSVLKDVMQNLHSPTYLKNFNIRFSKDKGEKNIKYDKFSNFNISFDTCILYKINRFPLVLFEEKMTYTKSKKKAKRKSIYVEFPNGNTYRSKHIISIFQNISTSNIIQLIILRKICKKIKEFDLYLVCHIAEFL